MGKRSKASQKNSRNAAKPARSPVSPQSSETAEHARPLAPSRSRWTWIAALLVLASLVAAVVVWTQWSGSISRRPPTPVAIPAATYVGGAQCTACHDKEHAAWKGSDHDLAMQIADEKSVLGNFAGAKFTYAGTTSTFSRHNDQFFVNTDGPERKLADDAITYTFGVRPLQQCLIESP